MVRDPLARLVSDAHGLPMPETATDDEVAPPRGIDRRRGRTPVYYDTLGPSALKQRVGALLTELAERVDAELPKKLSEAERAWDQIDTLRIVDRAVDEEARSLSASARVMKAESDPSLQALGLEAQLMIDTALGLVSLFERRLATLARLRLRGGDPNLLPDGQPFLDLGAALHEAARRWS